MTEARSARRVRGNLYYKIINKRKKLVTVIADILGYILWSPVNLFRKRPFPSTDDIREILVIRTAYIGDVVMTIPILKPLKDRFPNSRISFLTSTKAKEILQGNPYVDEIITYDPFWFYHSRKSEYFKFIKDLKKRRFDMVIEARGDIRELLFLVLPLKARSKVSYGVGGGGYLLTHVVPYRGLSHKVEYHLDIVRYLGCKTDRIEWGIYLSEDENKKAVELLAKEGVSLDKPLVVLHPGARKGLKCWSSESYAKIADVVIERYGVSLILTGTVEDMPLVKDIKGMMKNDCVNLAGKTTLRQMAGIMKRCSLVICNDSAPLHIAAAMNTPAVAIFGPSKSIETGPYGNSHVVVEKDMVCRTTCDEDVCRIKDYNQCMDDISVEDVLSAVQRLIKSG